MILAVVAANQDIAASDALKFARKFDKDGARTIGVLTKLDIMDKGTNAEQIFQGNNTIRYSNGSYPSDLFLLFRRKVCIIEIGIRWSEES